MGAVDSFRIDSISPSRMYRICLVLLLLAAVCLARPQDWSGNPLWAAGNHAWAGNPGWAAGNNAWAENPGWAAGNNDWANNPNWATGRRLNLVITGKLCFNND